jgi:putative PIN family toxin of toxin-antitoxin system
MQCAHRDGDVRLVLDTNIVVSGLIWGGVPRRLLDLGQDGQVMLFTSSILLDELAKVLFREKFEAMLASQNLTPPFLMQHYGMLTRLVTPRVIEHSARDLDDDVVLGTAMAAQANIIVTGDNDLLVMHPYHGIQILNPADAVRVLTEKITK